MRPTRKSSRSQRIINVRLISTASKFSRSSTTQGRTKRFTRTIVCYTYPSILKGKTQMSAPMLTLCSARTSSMPVMLCDRRWISSSHLIVQTMNSSRCYRLNLTRPLTSIAVPLWFSLKIQPTIYIASLLRHQRPQRCICLQVLRTIAISSSLTREWTISSASFTSQRMLT